MDLKKFAEDGINLITIRALNDQARCEVRCRADEKTVPCITAYPQYFQLLNQHEIFDITEAVRYAEFNASNPHNSPAGEHDFGSFICRDVSFHWTIDYYDNQLLYPSLDATDLSKTIRLLTIRLGWACCRNHPKCQC